MEQMTLSRPCAMVLSGVANGGRKSRPMVFTHRAVHGKLCATDTLAGLDLNVTDMNTPRARLLTALSASFLIGLHSAIAGAAEPKPAASLATEFVFEAHVTIDAPIVVGTGPQGLRRIVPITGGDFEGPRIKGTVLRGGADWQFVRGDGVLQIEAKYTLRTSDGVTIMITNRGMRHGPADVIDRLAKGEVVDPSLYYFRTVAELEAPSDSRYAWLNKALFLATAERQATIVNLRFYELK